ncbi:MAG: plastocyanin/azurin family copper-binding protein [Bacteroidota bacterium]
MPPARSLLLIALALIVSACGGGETVTILPAGNEMRYQQTEFTVGAGEEVTIIFQNTATSPAMQHNVVVLTTDDQAAVDRVGVAAISAAETDYVPADPAVLAHTPMSAPGETVEVTFTAPSEPGRYRYLCTFPGHYTAMQGVMIVA